MNFWHGFRVIPRDCYVLLVQLQDRLQTFLNVKKLMAFEKSIGIIFSIFYQGNTMYVKKSCGVAIIAAAIFSQTAFANGLESAIENGMVNGNIRAYYNTRDYETRTDEDVFSLGGALRVETAPWGGVKVGLAYYTAQDLGTNSSDPTKVNKRLGSEVEVFGEAYIKASFAETQATVGRQKINTPFANAGDAFIVPFTFEGGSIVNTSFDKLTIELNHINTVKNRNSEEFVDVGKWSTNRYGVDVESTSGTTILGAVYKDEGIKLQGWYYEFSELFTAVYLQANYSFAAGGEVKPFVAAQFGTQSETGDELLGAVDSTLWGLQGGAAVGKAKVTLAYTSVSEETDSFKNGAFLAPYNFSTSPLFTNNMLASMENVDSGDAYKLTLNYNLANTKLKLSYAEFDFDNADDREAIDADITYSMAAMVKGLSFRWRVEFVTSDNEAVEQINNRFQLQMKF
jgi:hypothetical protein